VPISELFRGIKGVENETDRLMLDELEVSESASLFTGAEESFAAARAISRLHQITSQEWWAAGSNDEPSSDAPSSSDATRESAVFA